MEIEDATHVLSWSQFTGSTIIRVVGSINVQPTWPSPGSDNATYTQYYHFGIGVTEDDTPEQSRWDPNTPHGDFMWRANALEEIVHRDAGNANHSAVYRGSGGVVDFDIPVKRLVDEDTRLWFFGHMFAPNSDFAGAVGYTGRVLILLP